MRPMPSPSLTRRQLLRGAGVFAAAAAHHGAAGIATAAAPGAEAAGGAAVTTRAGVGPYTHATAQTDDIGPCEDGVLPAGFRPGAGGGVASATFSLGSPTWPRRPGWQAPRRG